jgi:hypothetical protein
MQVIRVSDLAFAARESLGLSRDNWDVMPSCDLERVEELMPANIQLARVAPKTEVPYSPTKLKAGGSRKRNRRTK